MSIKKRQWWYYDLYEAWKWYFSASSWNSCLLFALLLMSGTDWTTSQMQKKSWLYSFLQYENIECEIINSSESSRSGASRAVCPKRLRAEMYFSPENLKPGGMHSFSPWKRVWKRNRRSRSPVLLHESLTWMSKGCLFTEWKHWLLREPTGCRLPGQAIRLQNYPFSDSQWEGSKTEQ